MYTTTTLTTALFLIALMPVRAQDSPMPGGADSTRSEGGMPTATTALADSATRARDSTHMAFANKDEGAWVGISGTVAHVGERSFVLKHDEGSVGVALGSQELRDHRFQDGQTVTVYGRVDKNFFDRRVIKARAVVVDGEHATQHLLVGESTTLNVLTASHTSGVVVHGRVTDIEGRKLVLERMDGRVIVDTSTLSYDPTKAEGHMRVERGDLVTAQGVLRGEMWSGRLMKAASLEVVKMGHAGQDGGEGGMATPGQETKDADPPAEQ
jgi:RNase P/RNase MRP subunit p29